MSTSLIFRDSDHCSRKQDSLPDSTNAASDQVVELTGLVSIQHLLQHYSTMLKENLLLLRGESIMAIILYIRGGRVVGEGKL